MVPITMVSSSYFVPEKRGGALADPGPGSENATLWELRRKFKIVRRELRKDMNLDRRAI